MFLVNNKDITIMPMDVALVSFIVDFEHGFVHLDVNNVSKY